MPVAHDRIRLANGTDIPVLLPMMWEYNRSESLEWNQERCTEAAERLLADSGIGFILVAVQDDPIGYAVVAYGFDLECGGKDAFVTELYVLPNSRCAGVGTALLRAAEETAGEAGVLALHMQVRPDNHGAYQLYERLGYQKVPRDTLSKTLAMPNTSTEESSTNNQ